jgi:hypothetical protein
MSPGARQLFELRADQCRWPHGDPQHDGFRWCSAHVPIPGPYCAVHAERSRNRHDQPRGVVRAIERSGILGHLRRLPDGVSAQPAPMAPQHVDGAVAAS